LGKDDMQSLPDMLAEKGYKMQSFQMRLVWHPKHHKPRWK
jgi:hypothetical protein